MTREQAKQEIIDLSKEPFEFIDLETRDKFLKEIVSILKRNNIDDYKIVCDERINSEDIDQNAFKIRICLPTQLLEWELDFVKGSAYYDEIMKNK